MLAYLLRNSSVCLLPSSSHRSYYKSIQTMMKIIFSFKDIKNNHTEEVLSTLLSEEDSMMEDQFYFIFFSFYFHFLFIFFFSLFIRLILILCDFLSSLYPPLSSEDSVPSSLSSSSSSLQNMILVSEGYEVVHQILALFIYLQPVCFLSFFLLDDIGYLISIIVYILAWASFSYSI